MSSTASPMQLIHLEALDESHHGKPFAIRARVLVECRDFETREPEKLILSTLPNDTLGNSQPEMTILLKGRWRPALNDVTRGTILQIECASIRPPTNFADAGSFSFVLKLDDDPDKSINHIFPPSVYVLDSYLGIAAGVSYKTLDDGLTPPTIEMRERFTRMRACWETTTRAIHVNNPRPYAQPTKPGRQPTLSSKPQIHPRERTSTCNYHMVSAIHDSKHTLIHSALNVYGVVVDCRAPCITKGTDLRSEIVIADESSMQEGAPLKTVQVYVFARKPADGIAFRSFGDIVQVHEGKAEIYVDKKSKKETTQLRIFPYSTVRLWRYDDTSFDPIESRTPGNTDHKGSDHEPVHKLSPYDRKRITELRKWVNDIFHPSSTSVYSAKSFLHSVSELRALKPNDGIRIDIFCLVEEAFENGARDGGIHLRVSDGLAEFMAIDSVPPAPYHLDRLGRYRFVDFIPCWRQRPRLPAWAYLKDVTVRQRDGDFALDFTVGKPTSTILFQPDVGAPIHPAIQSKPVRVNPCVDMPPTCLPVAPTVRVGNGRVNGHHAMGAVNAAEHASEMEVRKARKEQERRLPKLLENERAGLTISCIRGNGGSLKVSSLSDVIRDAQEGSQKVHRVRVDARVLLAPRELVHACLATCRRCEGEYVRSVVKGGGPSCTLECQKCGQRFYGREDCGLDWKFAMKVQLEDRSNGILNGWIEGDEGSLFFSGIVRPMCLIKNMEGKMKLMTCLQHVLTANRWLDCCVRAYRYMDEDGVYHVACKIVDTQLLLPSDVVP